jgi:hypothetical protein
MHQWASAFTGIDTKVVAVSFSTVRGDFRNPAAVAEWIEANVPCFSGPVPKEWIDSVWKEAGKRGISEQVLKAAFALTRKDGYIFPDGSDDLEVKPQVVETPGDSGPKIGPVDEDYVEKSRIATARILEVKFAVAVHSSNLAEMRRLAQAFADMLNAAAANGLAPLDDEEMQHGAPLLRRAIVWRVPPPAPEGGRGGAEGGPYRVSPTIETEFEEEENEEEAE